MSSIPVPDSMLLDECDAADLHRALNESFFDGLRVGRQGQPCDSPYVDGIGLSEFRRGWQKGLDEYAKACIERNARARKIAAELRERVKKCRYTDRECSCGGRGLCLDIC